MQAETTITIQSVAVVAHPQLQEAESEAFKVAEFLQKHAISSTFGLLPDDKLLRRVEEGEFDLLVTLGGDGTVLRASHVCGPSNVPILGVNMGRFGFLTEINKDQWQEALLHLVRGEFWLESRMMLRAEQWRSNKRLGFWDVLNEIVVSRGHIVRPVHLKAVVDGRELTTFVADGLIAATPTGSTAYALAAGGPILPPELRNILLVAVAPHLSIDRAIVLSEGSSVSIIVHTEHQAVLSPDGQTPFDIQDGDRVDAFASEHSLNFLRFQDPGYFYRNLTPHMSQNPSTGNRR